MCLDSDNIKSTQLCMFALNIKIYNLSMIKLSYLSVYLHLIYSNLTPQSDGVMVVQLLCH